MQVLDRRNFLRGAAGAALFGGFFPALFAACGDGELEDGEVITSWAWLPRRERKRERGHHDEREQRTAGTGSWSEPQGSRAAETFGQVSLESVPDAPTSVSTPLRDVLLRSV
jgi:hypothetical protein